MALARNVVHFDADAIGILEEDGVVPRGELRPVLRRVDDSRLELVGDEAMDGVDVFAAARAQAEVMQTGAFLVEGAVPFLRRRAAHDDAGTAADAVDHIIAP